MPPPFTRTRFTWFAYALWMFFGFFINVLGPLTPFLKDELKLSYTISSLHFTAFAAGILGVGLGGQGLVNRIGRERALWLGVGGLSVGAWLLLIGLSPIITIGASFVMGLLGSLIFVILPSTFSDAHGAHSAVALSEANSLASLVGVTAPLMVGWSAHTLGGWRLPVGVVALAPLGLYAAFRNVAFPAVAAVRAEDQAAPLPRAFWWYWAALFLAVSIEFCMLSWSADYVENTYGLLKVDAAQAVSLFLGGMIVGRWAGSRLVQRFAARALVLGSLCVAGVGFGLFWQGGGVWVALGGLFLTGLGVASLFPLILSLALLTTTNTVQASVRATLASGSAVLLLPLVLGRLADAFGIQLAYGVVVVLIVGAVGVVLLAGRQRG